MSKSTKVLNPVIAQAIEILVTRIVACYDADWSHMSFSKRDSADAALSAATTHISFHALAKAMARVVEAEKLVLR